MSNSVRPLRQQPTRLPRPWDSPGKNTGVGCHFLLQYMNVRSESEVAQSCLTLSDPMDCSLPDSCIHGIFQARVLEWGAIAFSDLGRGNIIHLVYENLIKKMVRFVSSRLIDFCIRSVPVKESFAISYPWEGQSPGSRLQMPEHQEYRRQSTVTTLMMLTIFSCAYWPLVYLLWQNIYCKCFSQLSFCCKNFILFIFL